MAPRLRDLRVSYGRVGQTPRWVNADADSDDTDPGRLAADVVAVLGLDPFTPPPARKSRGGFLRKSGLSADLRQRVLDGSAHWVTVTDEASPIHGRHLLIDGARGQHGPILAGHGIPRHVVEKLGATHSTHVDHVPTDHTPAGDPVPSPPARQTLETLTVADLDAASEEGWIRDRSLRRWRDIHAVAPLVPRTVAPDSPDAALLARWKDLPLPKGWRFVGPVGSPDAHRLWLHYRVPTPLGEQTLYVAPSVWHRGDVHEWQLQTPHLTWDGLDAGSLKALPARINRVMGDLAAAFDLPLTGEAQKKKDRAAQKTAQTTADATHLSQRLAGLGVAGVVFNKDSQTPKERQAVMQAATQAFTALGQILQVGKIRPVRLILGKLTLARGRTLAYYTAHDHAITIADKHGYGPFFHEYGHAIDFALGEVSRHTDGPWGAFMRHLRTEGAHPAYVADRQGRIQDLRSRRLGNVTAASQDLSYVRTPTEIFARFFAEWAQARLESHGGVPEALRDTVQRERWRDHPQAWQESVRLFEAALAHQDLLKSLQAGVDALAVLRKSPARSPRGVFIRRRGAAHRTGRGWNPNPRGRLRPNRPRGSAMPGEIGPGHAHPMSESSMQVMHAISASRRRSQAPDWGFDPLANAPGNTGTVKPVGTPGIFLYKSDPAIRQALHDYGALLDAGKTPATALQTVATRFPWVLDHDTPRARDWWAAVRRADRPRPAAYTDVDTEMDADQTAGRRRRAVFWRPDLANLGQGIMAPTGSGGAGR